MTVIHSIATGRFGVFSGEVRRQAATWGSSRDARQAVLFARRHKPKVIKTNLILARES